MVPNHKDIGNSTLLRYDEMGHAAILGRLKTMTRSTTSKLAKRSVDQNVNVLQWTCYITRDIARSKKL